MVSKIEPDRYADTGFSVKDTAPEINALLFQRVMALTPSERFMMGMTMLQTTREMIHASLPADLDEPQRRRLFFERMHGIPLPDAVANARGASAL